MFLVINVLLVCLSIVLAFSVMSTRAAAEPTLQSQDSMSGSPSNGSVADTASIEEQHDPERVLTQQISVASHRPPLSRRRTSVGTTGTTDPNFEIDWDDDDDSANPRNWPMWYKGLTIGFISWSTWVFSAPLESCI